MSRQKLNEFARLRKATGLSIEATAARLGVSRDTVYRYERGTTNARKAQLDSLRQLISAGTVESPDDGFTFVDLFAGIGGMRLAFERAGGTCVATCEIDKYCRITYEENFTVDGRHPFFGDITQLHTDEIPDHDVLVAGFPCQPFSIAGVTKLTALGRSHGFACEAQGTLFFDIARILRAKRPCAFLLENVKNLLSHDRGRTFDVIRKTLENDLGYHIAVDVLDAKPFVPQHRERTLIVGFRQNAGFDFEGIKREFPPRDAWPTLDSILHPENGTEREEPPYTIGAKARVNGKYTLTDHLWKYLQDYAAKHRAAGNGFGFGLAKREDVARTLSARYYKDGSEILIHQTRGRNPRRLTPRECSRLMGFDQFRPGGFKIPVSDTRAYKQFGNAVAVPLVGAVASRLAAFVRAEKAGRTDEPLLPFSVAQGAGLYRG